MVYLFEWLAPLAAIQEEYEQYCSNRIGICVTVYKFGVAVCISAQQLSKRNMPLRDFRLFPHNTQ